MGVAEVRKRRKRARNQAVAKRRPVQSTVVKEKKKGRRFRQYTAAEVIKALQASGGLKSVAAEKLGCSWYTINRYCNNYATVQRAYEEAREQLLDVAESELAIKVKAGYWPAIKWILATIGKNRGFIERMEQVLIPERDIADEYQRDIDRAYGPKALTGSGDSSGEPERSV